MVSITAHDEFRVLERVQECAGNPSLWPQTLQCVERSLKCRAYMLEFGPDKEHTGRFSDATQAKELIDFLDNVRTEANRTALRFLIDEAAVNYPYCKAQLTNRSKEVSKHPVPAEHPIANWPGLITPVLRSRGTTVLVGCLWSTISMEEADPDYVMPPFRRFAKAVSSALDVAERFSEAASRKEALQLMASSQKNAMCLIDEDLSIHFSTPSYRELLKDGHIFTVHGNRLVPTKKELETALTSVSQQVGAPFRSGAAAGQSLDATPVPEQSVFVSVHDEALCHVSIRGLPSLPGRPELAENNFILVEVRKPYKLSEDLKGLLRSAFGLSNGEARLAYDLAVSGSLAETLENLDITRNTAKTHLRRIYEKTSTQSQLELTQLIHSLSGLF
ncbi:helix-turn-helix transcriptional regulator [Roseibium polysiphoniae]|uniref:Helix-turn-helix transcriptional regulator n=1 Tax=Roseibium polysiphoniae TaxID=2571221 RepID=A0A944GTG2_9HYPH|nr:helix-turn-helix transcriptional regulator [Roseibium polysiphoniae]MBS8261232.1 helix-turn-helix transcriptional regulator [Roseibium polysiphoniae]